MLAELIRYQTTKPGFGGFAAVGWKPRWRVGKDASRQSQEGFRWNLIAISFS
jgi:hypothetical protein